MGMIIIEILGSFEPRAEKHFLVQGGGHAKAVAEAISFLSSEVLPRAIAHDHSLQDKGFYPDDRFGIEEK